MIKVLILYGGKSGEHEVSLLSAASVVRHLKDSYDIRLAGIDKEGVWYLQSDDLVSEVRSANGKLRIVSSPERIISIIPGRGFFTQAGRIDADVVFPVLHGSFGEDGTIQGLLDTVWIPYVGAGVLGSALGMDKEKTKQVWKEGGLPVVPSVTLRKSDMTSGKSGLEKKLSDAARHLGFPLFVKPACAGSSVGITKVNGPNDMLEALKEAFRYDSKILLEKGIEAREIECSIIGNEDPAAFTPGEVVPSHGFYDYDAKYTDPDGASLLIPAKLDEETLLHIREMAERAYKLACVEGMARVDFFLDKKDGSLYLNEINTIPGFTSISMFPRMCEHDGLLYPEILDRLIELSRERHARRDALKYSYQ